MRETDMNFYLQCIRTGLLTAHGDISQFASPDEIEEAIVPAAEASGTYGFGG